MVASPNPKELLSINEIKEKIAPIAKKYDVPSVYLFGSFAEGKADENSDIDLLIENSGSTIHSFYDELDFKFECEDQLGREVDVIDQKSINDETRMLPIISYRIKRSMIPIYEKQK